MAKGYIVADIHVRDKEGFEKFREMAKPVLEEYGAKVLVRTPNAEASRSGPSTLTNAGGGWKGRDASSLLRRRQ